MRPFYLILCLFLFSLVAANANAVDVFPDLVSGTYDFHARPGPPDPAVDPSVTATKSIGAMRVDNGNGDTGVLACGLVDSADYFAPVPISVTLNDASQNAEVRIFAFPTDNCTGLPSGTSADAARIFFVAPSVPELLAFRLLQVARLVRG